VAQSGERADDVRWGRLERMLLVAASLRPGVHLFFYLFFGSIAYESAELLDLNMSSVFQINHDHFAIHISKSG